MFISSKAFKERFFDIRTDTYSEIMLMYTGFVQIVESRKKRRTNTMAAKGSEAKNSVI